MPITVVCACSKRISVPDHFAGKAGKCKGCGARLEIPAIAVAGASDSPFGFSDEDIREAMKTINLAEIDDDIVVGDEPKSPIPEALDDEFDTETTPIPVAVSRYSYAMIQVNPTIEVGVGERTDQAAAAYLQRVVNKNAKDGWELFRMDSFSVDRPPGCLAGLFGARPDRHQYYVITFRKRIV